MKKKPCFFEQGLKKVIKMSNDNTKSNKNQQRFRHFSFIVYPEFLSDKDYFENVNQAQIDVYQKLISIGFSSIAVSPLHDKDFKDNGESKKQHFHIYHFVDNKKSLSAETKKLNYQGLFCFPEQLIVHDVRACLRYFKHLDEDNDIKPLYEDDILSTLDLVDVVNLALADKKSDSQIVSELLNDITDNEISSFHRFVDYIRVNKCYRLDFVLKKSYFFKSYIDSFKFSLRQKLDIISVEEDSRLLKNVKIN